MPIIAYCYRLITGRYPRYVEYSVRMLALLAGVCLIFLLSWMLLLRADESNSATLNAERLALKEASLARGTVQHAWRQYRRHSWGANELAPGAAAPSKEADRLVGRKSGLTIVESLATLHLMGLDEELLQAQEWIDNRFDFTNTTEPVSTAATSSRLLGGLLSAFSLTEHLPFLYKALQGPVAAGRFISLGEMSQLYLEFAYLHRLTGLQKYGNAADAILAPLRRHMDARIASRGKAKLANDSASIDFGWSPPGAWDVRTGAPTIGAASNLSGVLTLAEVTIKAHLLLDGDRDALSLFQELLSGRLRLDAWLNCQSGVEEDECGFNLTVCQLVETLLLSMGQSRDPFVQRDLAYQLGDLCLSAVQLGKVNWWPDQLVLRRSVARHSFKLMEAAANVRYSARPEPVLAGLLLWSRRRRMRHLRLLSLTLRSIARLMRGSNGYEGLRRVAAAGSPKSSLLQSDNRQPSYLLGQTLKYIYMAFKPNRLNLVSGEWVFNTAGQLLPVCSGRQFGELRQLVLKNWIEVRRQLEVLALVRLNRRRKGFGIDLDELRGAGSVRSRDLPGTLLIAVAPALLTLFA
ncbi:hypothetical protein BOX15_Mlig002647g1 [Macrostomum lignano]|uniref:alpha-1,2-Mannosidase n=1 Tax=Macrostomum lignano TaxID=282301 RepID=A0A267H7V4_9PLAT|nr:hypothetical protein BOX15_Mlig002647g1 [Macrostomum lignano]